MEPGGNLNPRNFEKHVWLLSIPRIYNHFSPPKNISCSRSCQMFQTFFQNRTHFREKRLRSILFKFFFSGILGHIRLGGPARLGVSVAKSKRNSGRGWPVGETRSVDRCQSNKRDEPHRFRDETEVPRAFRPKVQRSPEELPASQRARSNRDSGRIDDVCYVTAQVCLNSLSTLWLHG